MIQYVLADKEDIDALIQMRLQYIEEDQGQISEHDRTVMLDKLPEYFLKHLCKDLVAFVAKDNGKMVAVVMLLVVEKPSNPHFIKGRVADVLNVYTLPQYRKQGIARTLMENLLQYAKTLQLDYVELKATNDGYPLYKKLGFIEEHSPYTAMRSQI